MKLIPDFKERLLSRSLPFDFYMWFVIDEDDRKLLPESMHETFCEFAMRDFLYNFPKGPNGWILRSGKERKRLSEEQQLSRDLFEKQFDVELIHLVCDLFWAQHRYVAATQSLRDATASFEQQRSELVTLLSEE